MHLARWFADPLGDAARLLHGRTMVELGTGVGASGLAAALHCAPRRCVLTDWNAKTLANLTANARMLEEDHGIALLGPGEWARTLGAEAAAATAAGLGAGGGAAADEGLSRTVEVAALDWAKPATWDLDSGAGGSGGGRASVFEVVVGSDLIYDDGMADLLATVVDGLCAGKATDSGVGVFLYVAPPHGRAGLVRFLSTALPAKGFVHASATPSPSAYGANPLVSGDAAQAFLHFSELNAPYVLHVFLRTGGDAAAAAALAAGLIAEMAAGKAAAGDTATAGSEVAAGKAAAGAVVGGAMPPAPPE